MPVCVSLHVCAGAYTCVPMEARGYSTLYVFPNHSPPKRQGLSLSLSSPIVLAFLDSKPRRSAYVCHASIGHHHNPAVYVGAGASGPHAHTAGDLLSEPSLHPLLRIIFILFFSGW